MVAFILSLLLSSSPFQIQWNDYQAKMCIKCNEWVCVSVTVTGSVLATALNKVVKIWRVQNTTSN